MKKILLIFTVILASCTTTKNISPTPTIVPASLSEFEVEQAIMNALQDTPKPQTQSDCMQLANNILSSAFGDGFGRNQYWFLEGRGKNIVYAGYHYRDFYMHTEIRYDKNDVSFKITDSRNLKQSKNAIHKNAFVWLGNLESSVRLNLGKMDRLKYEQALKTKKYVY